MNSTQKLMIIGEAINWKRIKLTGIKDQWIFAVPAGRLGYIRFCANFDQYWIEKAVSIGYDRMKNG